MNNLKRHFTLYFKAMSQTYFFDNPAFGAALLLLFLIFDRELFAYGFAASLVGYGYSIRYSTPKVLKDWGLITINCFFFGIAMASLFQKTPTFFLCFALGVAGVPLMTKAVFEVLQHWKLSPFILPYILMVWMVVLAGHSPFLEYQVITQPEVAPALRFLASIFQGMGRLLFLPDPVFGLAVFALVTAFSPRRGFYFLAGTIAATLAGFLLSPHSNQWQHGYSNYSAGLVGLGLASFPEKFKFQTILFFCILSSIGTLAVEQFLKILQLPILSLPYVLTLWFGFLSRLPRLNLSWVPSGPRENEPCGR